MGQLIDRFQRQVQMIAFRRLGNWDEALELSQEYSSLRFVEFINCKRPRLSLVGCGRSSTGRPSIT